MILAAFIIAVVAAMFLVCNIMLTLGNANRIGKIEEQMDKLTDIVDGMFDAINQIDDLK